MTVLCVLSPLTFSTHGSCCTDCGRRELSVGGDGDGATTTASVALAGGGVLVHRSSVIFTPARRQSQPQRGRRFTQTATSPSISGLDRDVSRALLSTSTSSSNGKKRSVSVGTCVSTRTTSSFSQSAKFHHTSTELHDLDMLEREEEEDAEVGDGDKIPRTPPPSPPIFDQTKIFKEENSPSPGLEEVRFGVEEAMQPDPSVQIPMIDSVHESNQCQT